jgi:hypothetical protein
VGKIALALSKAQGEFKELKKSRTAEVVMKDNKGKYTYAYADLADVVACCKEALAKNELAWFQDVVDQGVTTILIHSSGETIRNWVPLQFTGGSAQVFGSALTYARRYGLTSLLGIVAEEDDDGARATQGGGSGSEKRSTGQTTQRAAGQKGVGTPPVKASQADWEVKPITEKQRAMMWSLAKKVGYSKEHMAEMVKTAFGKESSTELTQKEASILIDELQGQAGGK